MKNDINFLIEFGKLCRGTEIPELFAFWSGIAGLSAVLGRKCFIDMGTYTIFPNLYIVLVGASGQVRKSTSINVIEKLIRNMPEPQPNLIAQKITPEALIQALDIMGTTTGITDSRADQVPSCGFVVADELNTFLNRASYEAGMGSILIQLYDCKDRFEYHTKMHGKQVLNSTCLGMLAASTMDWLITSIPENAIGGGLTSRMIFIYVAEPAPPVAWTEYPEAKKILQQQLVQALVRIATISGNFILTPESKQFYIDTYNAFYNQLGREMYTSKNLAGYASRRHVHGLKLAMLFSASENSSRIISLDHLQGAMAMIEEAERFMPTVLHLISSTNQGTLMTELLDYVRKHKIGYKKEMIKMMSNKLNSRETEILLETLLSSGQLVSSVYGDNVLFKIPEAT